MKDEIKEIYLSDLEWTKTHDNMGGVMGNVVFKDNMSYEEYNKLSKSGYFILCDKDYITNLQEQLHQASLDIQELTEKDIGCPSWCDKLTNLQEENERLHKELDYANNDNIYYIAKIDKAIEILKLCNSKCSKQVINILNGGDE